MQPFDLWRAEQGLRAGVVPAVALAAHGSLDAILALDDTRDVHVLIDFIRTETGFALLINTDCL